VEPPLPLYDGRLIICRVFSRIQDRGPWKVLAVSREIRMGPALKALGNYGRFRRSGYPKVIIGEINPDCSLSELGAATDSSVLRLFEAEQCLDFERDDVTETLCLALEPQAHRVCGRRFFVRARLRSMKGRLETPAVERALGAFLFNRARQLGEPATVDFAEPDLVLAVETIGARVAWALIDSQMLSLPFIRTR